MTEEKIIAVHNPNNLPTVPWKQLKPFQKDFKKPLTPARLQKLKNSLLKHGVFVPKFVWWDKGHPYIMDGHQTRLTLASLVRDGYTIPAIPIAAIDASNQQEAAEKLLILNSRYAEVNHATEWLAQFEFELEELNNVIELPDLDLEQALSNIVSGNESTDKAPRTRHVDMADLAPDENEMERLHGKFFCVEYSGGKDSSAAALWLRQYYDQLEPASVQLVFVDLGADFVGFHDHLYAFAAAIDFDFKILRSKTHMIDLMIEKGKWPHAIHPYCHQLLHDTLDKYFKTIGHEQLVVIRGGRLGESTRVSKKNTDRFLNIDRLPGFTFFQPLYFAPKVLCEEVIVASSCPVWRGYDRGLHRTACRICPGQKPRSYAALRNNYPDVWEELLWLEKRFGAGAWWDPENALSGRFSDLADIGVRHLAKDAEKTQKKQ